MTGKKTEIDVKREPKGEMAIHAEWEPFRALRSQFDRMLQEFDWPDFRFGLPRRGVEHLRNWPDLGAAIPPVDLVERNGAYEMQVELPGLTRDQIDIKLADDMMTIKGEKTAEHAEDEEGYHLRERSYGLFQRSFRLPAGVDANKIGAQFENGVLKITLPKSAEAISKERKIEVKAA